MKKPSLKLILISLVGLYVLVQCGSGIFSDDSKSKDKSDDKSSDGIELVSRKATQGTEKQSIINSINPVFIYDSYVKVIGIYKEESKDEAKVGGENKAEKEAEITKDSKKELTSVEIVSLLTPFIFLFCAIAIIRVIRRFRWEKYSSPYFDKFLK